MEKIKPEEVKIFSISLENSKMQDRTDLLDWLTNYNTGAGFANDKYWLIDTSVKLQENGSIGIATLNSLLMQTSMSGNTFLMIKKKYEQSENKDKTEEQSTDNSVDENTNG